MSCETSIDLNQTNSSSLPHSCLTVDNIVRAAPLRTGLSQARLRILQSTICVTTFVPKPAPLPPARSLDTVECQGHTCPPYSYSRICKSKSQQARSKPVVFLSQSHSPSPQEMSTLEPLHESFRRGQADQRIWMESLARSRVWRTCFDVPG